MTMSASVRVLGARKSCVRQRMRARARAGLMKVDWADLAIQSGGIFPTSLGSDRGRAVAVSALELGGSRFTMGP